MALKIDDAVLLTWPLAATALQVETSDDLREWVPLPGQVVSRDGRRSVAVPRDRAGKFFRLVTVGP